MLLSSKTKSHQFPNLSTDFRTVPSAKIQCQENDLSQHSDRGRDSDCENNRNRDCDNDTIITINADGYQNSGEYNWFQ